MIKPLLVGEANPYGTDPRYALFPHPKSSAGYRLARLIMAMPSRETYLERFDRVNLCPQKWSAPIARFSAQRIMSGDHTRIVLLGSKVCGAFGFDFKSYVFGQHRADAPGAKTYIVLPHPSGLCRAWGEPGAFERARQVLVSAGVLS